MKDNKIVEILISVAETANEVVLPICKDLDLPVFKERIIEWTRNVDSFRKSYELHHVRLGTGGYRYHETALIRDEANARFDRELSLHPYPADLPPAIDDKMMRLLVFEDGQLTIDTANLDELTGCEEAQASDE